MSSLGGTVSTFSTEGTVAVCIDDLSQQYRSKAGLEIAVLV